ncbi:MAG: alkane 1-monooxygenase [Pseudomonadota bacterium]
MREIQPGLRAALPFWVSLALLPLVAVAALNGGWTIALIPMAILGIVSAFDALAGLSFDVVRAGADRRAMIWHRAILYLWAPAHLALIVASAGVPGWPGHFELGESLAFAAAVGAVFGTVSIAYAHELIHSRHGWERTLGTWMFISMLNGQHATAHLAIHHRHVATPLDPSTAPLGQGFWRFLPRLLWTAFWRGLAVEAARQRHLRRPAWHWRNPYWQYVLGALGFLLLAYGLGGAQGLLGYLVAVGFGTVLLAVADYMQHYGLSRRQLPDGRFEPVQAHHSWNAAQRVSGWLLVNAPRHSDHHQSGAKPYPELRPLKRRVAPQMPVNFLLMTLLATMPTLWRLVMDRRVEAWRARHYPDGI